METYIIFSAWTLFGLFASSQRYVLAGFRAQPVPTAELVLGSLVEAWLWAIATVAIFWMARRFPFTSGRLTRQAVIHMAAAVLLSVARAVVIVALAEWTPLFRVRSLSAQFFNHFHQYVLFYGLLLGIAGAIHYYARFREREMVAERLSVGLTEARLQALKAQLQPHFLFNTLNSISALIPADAQPARRMVARLGDLLRISLEHEDAQEVTLSAELEFLEPYTEIECIRLGDRLEVRTEVDPETLGARVPHLVLQPLVENAIRHGIAALSSGGAVWIAARREGDQLVVSVRNDAPVASRGTSGGGMGLANIRSRLEQLYGPDHEFRSERTSRGEWLAEMSIPFHIAGASRPEISRETCRFAL